MCPSAMPSISSLRLDSCRLPTTRGWGYSKLAKQPPKMRTCTIRLEILWLAPEKCLFLSFNFAFAAYSRRCSSIHTLFRTLCVYGSLHDVRKSKQSTVSVYTKQWEHASRSVHAVLVCEFTFATRHTHTHTKVQARIQRMTNQNTPLTSYWLLITLVIESSSSENWDYTQCICADASLWCRSLITLYSPNVSDERKYKSMCLHSILSQQSAVVSDGQVLIQQICSFVWMNV